MNRERAAEIIGNIDEKYIAEISGFSEEDTPFVKKPSVFKLRPAAVAALLAALVLAVTAGIGFGTGLFGTGKQKLLPGGTLNNPNAEINYKQFSESLSGPFPTLETLLKRQNIFKGKVAGGSFNIIVYEKHNEGEYRQRLYTHLLFMITPVEVTEVLSDNENLKAGDIIYVAENYVYLNDLLCQDASIINWGLSEHKGEYVSFNRSFYPLLDPEHEYVFFGSNMKMSDFEKIYLSKNNYIDYSYINGKINEFSFICDWFDVFEKPEARRYGKDYVKIYDDVMERLFGETR